MRHSSVKFVVVILSITVTLLAAVPTASAATVQAARQTQTTHSREDAKIDRLAAVRQFVNRMLRRIGTNEAPSIPIPKVDPTNP